MGVAVWGMSVSGMGGGRVGHETSGVGWGGQELSSRHWDTVTMVADITVDWDKKDSEMCTSEPGMGGATEGGRQRPGRWMGAPRHGLPRGQISGQGRDNGHPATTLQAQE